MRIDLSGVDFIDSLGIGALLRVWRGWEERGHHIELVAPARPAVRRVFDLMGADDELPFVGQVVAPSGALHGPRLTRYLDTRGGSLPFGPR